MSIIPLYGYIFNPLEGCDVFYILKESQETPNKYLFEGRIGYGSMSEEDEEDEETDISCNESDFPVKYTSADMRDFKFTYNIETKEVVVKTHYRYCYHPPEAQRLQKNVIAEIPDEDEDTDNSFPYFCFPRSKDGIAVSRVFNTIFNEKDITIYLPANHN